LSLGVETLGGLMTVLVPRNTHIPWKKTEIFSTASDSQPAVDIHVLQGERKMARDNRTLGKFTLAGIPPAPRGVPQIEVTFDIDADGILHVNAKDKATGKEQRIEVKASSGLARDEVDRMVRDAQSHETDDKEHAEYVDARNRADTLCYQTEKFLREDQGKVPAEDRTRIEEAIRGVREAMKEEDRAKLSSAMRKLEEASAKLAEQLYKNTSPPPEQGQAGETRAEPDGAGRSGPRKPSAENDGDVIDVEPRRVDK
jgi:molecular chaperone DnaK